jgi:hypothetical protein
MKLLFSNAVNENLNTGLYKGILLPLHYLDVMVCIMKQCSNDTFCKPFVHLFFHLPENLKGQTVLTLQSVGSGISLSGFESNFI